jgi:hypothetical protein
LSKELERRLFEALYECFKGVIPFGQKQVEQLRRTTKEMIRTILSIAEEAAEKKAQLILGQYLLSLEEGKEEKKPKKTPKALEEKLTKELGELSVTEQELEKLLDNKE